MFRKEDDPSLLSGLNFQFTLSLLWLLSTLLNLPTLLAWVQNLDKVLWSRIQMGSVFTIQQLFLDPYSKYGSGYPQLKLKKKNRLQLTNFTVLKQKQKIINNLFF